MTFPASMRRGTFGRLLFLQSCWSYDAMQGVGLAFALEPWLKRVHGARAGAALSRYAGCFNTHPFMAPLTVGMLCGLEEEAAAAESDKRDALLKRADALKTAVACSLAGIGDALFWGALRPACAAAALIAGMLGWRLAGPAGLLLMPLLYLALYDLPALWLRWRGLSWGYEWKADIASRLKGFAWQTWISRAKKTAAVLLVALLLLVTAAAGSWAERAAGLFAAGAYALASRRAPGTTAASFYAWACLAGVIGSAAGWL